jgi:hypothetical protein
MLVDVTESTLISAVFIVLGLILLIRGRATFSIVLSGGGGDVSSSNKIASKQIKLRGASARIIGTLLFSVGLLVLNLYVGQIVLFTV